MRIFVTEHLGGNKARFECENGHSWSAPIIPQKKRARGVGEAGFKMLARFWRKENNGVSATCPQCQKLKATLKGDSHAI